MRVAVTGATGFIGRHLVTSLLARGDSVTALTRDPVHARGLLGDHVECVAWSPEEPTGVWRGALSNANAVVHLAGEPIANRRWNPAIKKRILDSRVLGTRHLVDAIAKGGHRPGVFVCASGSDFYGADAGERELDETSPRGAGFLSDVCVAWESEAARAAEWGVREVRLRTGVVLGDSGGALEKMSGPFRWFIGGPVGSGMQWVPWIAIDDLVAIVLLAIDRDSVRGPINVVGPAPVRMREFAKALGAAMGRPSWFRVPSFAVKLAAGDVADSVVGSKRMVSRILAREGFVWRVNSVHDAMKRAVGTE